MPKNRILLKFLQVPVLVIACFALLPVVQVAAGIGISPALLSNQWLRPGMTYRQEIIISQSDPVHDLDVVIEPDLGEANDWLSYDPSDSFTISKGVKRYPMTIMFTVPEGAELKSYTGYIRIKTTPRNEEVAGGVSVVQGARIDVDIRTTDEEYQELAVLAMSIADVEEGSEAALKLTIENLGNVDTAPDSVEIEIQDLNKNPLQSIKLTDLELVPVSTRKDVYTNFSLNVNPGEYFAHVRVLKADNILREDDLVFRQLGTAVVTSPRLQVDGGFLSRIFGENLPLNIALLLFEALVVIVAVALVLRQKKYSQESMTRIKIAATLTFIVVALVSIVLLNSQPLGVVLGKSTTGSPLTGQMQAVQGISTEAGITYYPIYEKPDYESGVIYRAVEGETFEIVEDQGDWLKVTLPDSLVGWLSRLNVKQ